MDRGDIATSAQVCDEVKATDSGLGVSTSATEPVADSIEQLISKEMETGGASGAEFSQMLVKHLIDNDLIAARLLWKRVPKATKDADSELTALWAVAALILRSDYPAAYKALCDTRWSDQLKCVINKCDSISRIKKF